MSFEKMFSQIATLKVIVLGDLMLDTYLWGSTDRISPEAPVPIVTLKKRELRVGGAANVALNIKAFNTTCFAIGVTGADKDGNELKQLLNQTAINTHYLLQLEDRVTTNKIRIISRNQQMMRLDTEQTNDINAEQENLLIEKVEQCIKEQKPQVLIFEDYNKGVLTNHVIEQVVALCKQHGVITTVDPKRKNFFSYMGVDIFKPNLKEAREGLNLLEETVNLPVMNKMHIALKAQLNHQYSLITLSEKGIFYNHQEEGNIIASHIRNIADVSGAGDTVIAVASLVYAATKNIKLSAEVANIAGGLVCEVVGTAPINAGLLQIEVNKLLCNFFPEA
jgi:D-glycero-beta-D-manno-heptose-7-phosphate kinase